MSEEYAVIMVSASGFANDNVLPFHRMLIQQGSVP